MKIARIEIENFKSIQSLVLSPSEKLNVFIGENSVGKSNIFDAINWLLGPVYPSFNNIKDEDRYLGNPDNRIRIRLTFDDGAYLELAEEWRDSWGRTKSGLNCSGNYVNDETRQNYASAYLGVDRKILDYMPSNRWSLLGRILLEINKLFLQETVSLPDGSTISKAELFRQRIEKVRDELLFSVEDDEGNKLMKDFVRLLQKESARQLNKPESEFEVDLNLYDPWNYYRTLQLIVKEFDTEMEFQAASLGMGVQASISIAILKAYSELKLRNKTPLFVDEPELFLHPQAQRNFYSILRDIAENGTQLFITTHSPNFVSVEHFDEVFVVRKTAVKGTFVNRAEAKAFAEDYEVRKGRQSSEEDVLLDYRNAYENTGDSASANEAFFAKRIILVEGQSEALCLPYLFSVIEFDFVKEGISIVRCGGKSELARFFRLYNELGIPCFVIFDGDSHLIGTAEEERNRQKNKEIFDVLGVNEEYPDGTVEDTYLGFEDEFEKELGFETTKKGLSLYREVKRTIEVEPDAPEWVLELQRKVMALEDAPDSALLVLETEEDFEPPF